MSVQEPSHYAEEDMVLVAGSDYIRMASIGGGLLSIKLPTVGDSTPIVEGVSGELLAVNGGTYVDQGRLAVTHIRASGDGTGVTLPDNIMMYNPSGNPKEITYSNDIPIRLNTFDVSLNIIDVSMNGLDISVNIIDVSLNVHDDRLNGLDISVNIIDVNLNVHDVSLNGLDISVNIIDVSLNMIDSTLYSGSKFAIGAGSSADGTNSFAIGNNATTSTYNNAVAIGCDSSVGGDYTVSIGEQASANTVNSTAIGRLSSATGNGSTALGFSSSASGTNSISIGDNTVSENNQIKIGKSSSTYDMEGRLNLVNNLSSSLITFGEAIKLFRSENGLTIGNYGKFAVNVADTTAEPTSVPPRNGINMIFLNDNGISNFGTSNNNQETHIRSSLHGTFLDGYGGTTATLQINNNNQIYKSSDIRLKENITHYDKPSIEKIMKLKPAYYTWKDDKSKNPHINLGFIAQEVEVLIPEAVDGKKYEYEWEKDEEGEAILDASGNLQFTDKPRYRGFSDRPLIAVLVKAVQEQQEIIETEKAKNAALETQITSILARLDALETP
jgi:hypothetical protein